MNTRWKTRFAALTATVLLLTGCGGSTTDPATAPQTSELEVMSWWTSASERAALKVTFDAFTSSHSGVTLTDASVAGGSGSNVTVELAKRLSAGDPPDVWQGFVGGYLQSAAGRGQLADATGAFTGLAEQLPPAIRDAVTSGGKPYGVPTGSHRGNVLFFSVKALAKAGITPPAQGYTMQAFLADLAKAKAAGVTGLCLGGKDAFTTVELLENVLLARIGTDGWAKVAKGSFSWSGSESAEALGTLGRLLDFAGPDAATKTWDAATADLAAGNCAFESMNDSAYGELVAKGAADGTDFGYVAFPGTEGAYVAVVDVFVASATGSNVRNAVEFLATAADPAVQLQFNKLKGSVPIRADVDVSSLSPYQQAAAKAMRTGPVLLSAAHGEAVSPAIHAALYQAVAEFSRSRDVKAFGRTLDEVGVAPPGGR